MKRFLTVPILAGLVAVTGACSDTSSPLAPDASQERVPLSETPGTLATATMTIAEIVVDKATNENQFTQLLDAVLAAQPQVLETLSGNGRYTVFAPTDEAFDALISTGALDGISQEALTEVLLYHVARGSEHLTDGPLTRTVRMLNGDFAQVDLELSTINGASIVTTDIQARNGTIHVIDAVLLPQSVVGNNARPSILDIVEASAAADPAQFTILKAALDAASEEVANALDGRNQLTVFAPTDAAFVALLGDLGLTAEELLGNADLLDAVLLYHVTRGRLSAQAVGSRPEIRMLDGNLVTVDAGTLNGSAAIIATDIQARNGIVHVIDAVLLPPM